MNRDLQMISYTETFNLIPIFFSYLKSHLEVTKGQIEK